MAKAVWFPKASRVQTYDSKYPGLLANRIDGVVLHSTEGVGWPSYKSGASAPNMTINFDHKNKKVLYRQHFQANRSSRALAGYSLGKSNNRFHIFQIEIVGTSGWATTRNSRRDYTLSEMWYVPGYPDWALQGIAEVLGWLNREWGVPLVAPYEFTPWNTDRRMSESQWGSFKGICGHQHVPHNDHSDPGAIPIAKIISMAKGSYSPAKPAPAPVAPKPVVKPAPKPVVKPAPKPAPAPNKPKLVNAVSVSHLRAQMLADTKAKGQPLGKYKDEVFTMETALVKTSWLRPQYADGHYGTTTVGDGSSGFGGVTGFQKKHSGTSRPDGWMGPRELALLFRMAGMSVRVVK